MREHKEAQRKKQDKLDRLRLEEDAKAEELAKQKRKEKEDHEESEY